jgi:hypothetical protein
MANLAEAEMKMPLLSAECSIYVSNRSYHQQPASDDHLAVVTIQAQRSPVDVAVGDEWRRACKAEGGSLLLCCKDKTDDCKDECGTESCEAHCSEKGKQCRGELVIVPRRPTIDDPVVVW